MVTDMFQGAQELKRIGRRLMTVLHRQAPVYSSELILVET
jgi:hypothetical protein